VQQVVFGKMQGGPSCFCFILDFWSEMCLLQSSMLGIFGGAIAALLGGKKKM